MKRLALPLALAALAPATARADAADPQELANLERLHAESMETRRTLAHVVLVDGIVGVTGGALLMIPSSADLGFRFAGLHTLIFGAINTGVGLYALHGIAAEERRWNANSESRRTREGLARGKAHAAEDERRESVSHALNLGLDVAYAAIGGTAIVASQAGVEHPNRWLGAGIALCVQATVLVVVDVVGLSRSAEYHAGFVSPTLGGTVKAPEVGIAYSLQW